MKTTLTQKVIEQHLVEGSFEPGSEIGVRIDHTLTQDATGTMAYLQFEALGLDRAATELSVSFVDHNTMQIGPENADDHRYLRTSAAKYGAYYSGAGNGICHQVYLERFGRPGATLLGADSHSPTAGGIGQIAVGAGGLDVALAMGGNPFFMACPHVIGISLCGRLAPWVSAKDVILKVLEIFTTKGNVGRVFEYTGPGVGALSVPERATIANMGAECGVTTSIFPSDGETRRFLAAQGREDVYRQLSADEGAEYHQNVDIDLSAVVPMVACPHSPGNVRAVADMKPVKVDQVCVGSCTNSSYVDLMRVAEMLRDRKVHPDVSFVLAAGSRQVLSMLAGNGALADLMAAGARIAETACGFCIGNGQSPRDGAVSLRTSNRNFRGRSGTPTADVYLVSPETAAAAAITGELTDPRRLGMDYPSVAMPEHFTVDDSMILAPPYTGADVQVLQGPNIKEPVTNDEMPDSITGNVTARLGDRITTDDIIPAGDKMKFRSNVPKYSEYLFHAVSPGFYTRAKKIRESGRDNIVVAGMSYGQGSSREHAALCPMFMGVRAVIAGSFERIHAANLVNFGVLPLVFENEDDYNSVAEGDELDIPDVRDAVASGRPLTVHNRTGNTRFGVLCELSPRAREIVLAGGALALAGKTRR